MPKLSWRASMIPSEWRPPIWVRVLPALENMFYGANLSKFLSAHQNTVLDILAWLPYGIIHFGAPFVCSTVMFIFGPPGTVPNFARSFGWMNVVGVTIQLLFPCSPPWYENIYGLAPANYSIPGSPAGLARLDLLFGIDLYTSKFTASPMVFGAFPSLHAGSATIEALFMSHVFPQYWGFFLVYTMWLWWATMYLSHHYAVDLVGGSLRKSTSPGLRTAILTTIQLLRWSSTSTRGTSYPGAKPIRLSAGTTTTSRSARNPTAASRISVPRDYWTTGPSGRFPPSTRGPLVPVMATIPGTRRRWGRVVRIRSLMCDARFLKLLVSVVFRTSVCC